MNDNVDYDKILNHQYWFHRIPLGNDKFTPGLFQRDPFNWEQLKLPHRLDGKSFLDIGAFDGLHSFEAEKRGAKKVLATDIWCGPTGKEGFDLAHKYLNSNIEDKLIDVYDISPQTVGKFDIVLCSGLIYHLRDPYLAIKNAVSVAKELVVIESAITNSLPSGPGMRLGRARPSAPTEIRWTPNIQCLEQMLNIAGCTDVKSHLYTPKTNPGINIPPVKDGIITNPTTLYKNHTLDTKISDLDVGKRVFVLYEMDTSTKIGTKVNENETRKTTFQGWIDSNDIHNGSLSRLASRLRRQTVSGCLSKVFRHLCRSNKGTRGVVCGSIPNNSK